MSEVSTQEPDRDAGDYPASSLMPEVYGELRLLADMWFNRQPADHTLQPTALVHEAYLRLTERNSARFRSRTHFLAVASRAMRQVLIDYARKRQAQKRGGDRNRVTLLDATEDSPAMEVDLVKLNGALRRLNELNTRQCRLVELRFLAGLTVDEAAQVLSISPRTAKIDWRMARAWLLLQLRERE